MFSIENNGTMMSFFIDYKAIKDLRIYYKLETPLPIRINDE